MVFCKGAAAALTVDEWKHLQNQQFSERLKTLGALTGNFFYLTIRALVHEFYYKR